MPLAYPPAVQRLGGAFALAALLSVPLASCAPAQADALVTAAVVPWGDALAAGLQALAAAAVPLAVAALGAAAVRVAGPLRFLVSTTLVERLVRNATDYALNAVEGAVRGRTLTVPLGSAVIARAVERALDQGPGWLIAAAGGPKGLAEKIFRLLSLEAGADAANTLAPGLDAARTARRRRA